MQHLANDVGEKLARNGQRNSAQEGMIRELCTAMRNIEMQIGNTRKENVLTYQKATMVEVQMAGIGKAIEEKVNKSFSSAAQGCEEKRHEGTKVEASFSKEPSKGDRSAELSPGSAFGQDSRRLGVGTKSEQPPETEKGQKRDFDTDSINTEKDRTIQPPKVENAPMDWKATSNWGENEWSNDQNYQEWPTGGWGQSIPQTQYTVYHKGSFANSGEGGGVNSLGKSSKDRPWR